jgi:hypothetical protein
MTDKNYKNFANKYTKMNASSVLGSEFVTKSYDVITNIFLYRNSESVYSEKYFSSVSRSNFVD